MARKPALPLLVACMVVSTTVACRRPAPHLSADAALGPALMTRFLETRGMDSAPPPSPDLKTAAARGQGKRRRDGGVPEVLNVADDCTVHAVWWAAHLCGLTAKGDARFAAETGWVSTAVVLAGSPRVDCPSQVTRFETVISGLPPGSYRFGTDRKYLEFTIRCTRPR